MKYEPLVSIVIPVYNGSNYMAEAIDSALNQTYKNTEIIVVNDGSTDDGATERIAISYGDKIRYFSKPNGGVSSALNTAIRHMRGEWLSWLSHDDLYRPNKIEAQIVYLNELLQDNKIEQIESLCMYSALARIDANGNFLSKKTFQSHQQSPVDFLISNIKRYSIGGCTVLMSKKVLNQVGGFDENIRTVSDADLWFRIMLAGYKFVYLDEILVYSRQHKQQVGNRNIDLFEAEHIALINNVTDRLLDLDLSRQQKYKLLEGLVLNGFVDASTRVKNSIKQGEQASVWWNVKIGVFIKLRRQIFFIARKLYRKLTLK